MVDERKLIEKGFKKFNNILTQNKGTYSHSYQLEVRDKNNEDALAYFINIDLHDMNKMQGSNMLPVLLKEGLHGTFEAHLINKYGLTFCVSINEYYIDKALEFIDNIYYKMNCIPLGIKI